MTLQWVRLRFVDLTGFKTFWVVQSKRPVIDTIIKLNKRNKANLFLPSIFLLYIPSYPMIIS